MWAIEHPLSAALQALMHRCHPQLIFGDKGNVRRGGKPKGCTLLILVSIHLKRRIKIWKQRTKKEQKKNKKKRSNNLNLQRQHWRWVTQRSQYRAPFYQFLLEHPCQAIKTNVPPTKTNFTSLHETPLQQDTSTGTGNENPIAPLNPCKWSHGPSKQQQQHRRRDVATQQKRPSHEQPPPTTTTQETHGQLAKWEKTLNPEAWSQLKWRQGRKLRERRARGGGGNGGGEGGRRRRRRRGEKTCGRREVQIHDDGMLL